MMDDYRCTEFCPKMVGIVDKKFNLALKLKKEHPRAINHHNFIKSNNGIYKNIFMEAYNNKCAYCGVALPIIPKEAFEIDHYICEKDDTKISKEMKNNTINLVLACRICNSKKKSFIFSKEGVDLFSPDNENIAKLFYRDEFFNIKISDEYIDNEEVVEFYEKVHLGSEIRRIDYIIMYFEGLIENSKNNTNKVKLYEMKDRLLNKRSKYSI